MQFITVSSKPLICDIEKCELNEYDFRCRDLICCCCHIQWYYFLYKLDQTCCGLFYCFARDCVTMYVTCYLKNQMYSQYPLQSLYVGIFTDRYEQALWKQLYCVQCCDYLFLLYNNMYIDLNLFFIFSFMTYVNSSELGAKYQTQITFSWYCIHKDNYT